MDRSMNYEDKWIQIKYANSEYIYNNEVYLFKNRIECTKWTKGCIAYAFWWIEESSVRLYKIFFFLIFFSSSDF